MRNFWKTVNGIIDAADIIIIILDARMPFLTRHEELEKKTKLKEKKILFVINKCDLISKKLVESYKRKIKPSVFVSAKKHYGTNILRTKLMEISKGTPVTVGVVGYPNVGKSSVINMLKGKTSAKTSPVSGYTKGIQKVKVSGKIMMLDSPGVIPYEEKNDYKQTLIGTINFDKEKDPEFIVLKLIEELEGTIEDTYGVDKDDDPEIVLERIAIKRNKLKAGGTPDTLTMSRLILKDWQHGKVNFLNEDD